MQIGNWDNEIHEDADQIKRMLSAKKIKDKDVIAFDAVNHTMQIIGSSGEAYDVTLDSCTCTDFSVRKEPCKHIYKLADKLNLLPKLPVVNKSLAEAFREQIPAEIERYKALYFTGAISAEKYCKIVAALKSK